VWGVAVLRRPCKWGARIKGSKSGAQPLNFLPRVYLAGWRLWVGGLKDDTCVVTKPPDRL